MSTTSGGKLMARMLEAEGVDTLFGIIDGTYLHLFAHAVERGMRLVTPRHETSALHMAGAYARLSGKLGVALASNGPGVANALPGVAVEQSEGNRVLLLTSSRRSGISYPDRGGAYQCFDQTAVIRPMAKWSESAQSFARIPELLRQALRVSFQGRPGLVHLDVAEDLINGEGEDAYPLQSPEQYRRTRPLPPDPAQVERAAAMLAEAELPLIHAGSGVIHAGAFAELERLAGLLGCPVTTSWSARGVLAESSPLAYPMVHIELCNQVRRRADVALCLGARLGETDWWGKPPYWPRTAEQPLIQVDIDEAALGRNRPAALAVQADIKLFLQALIAALEARDRPVDTAARKPALEELATARAAARQELEDSLADMAVPMFTGHVATVCRRVFADDAVAVFDGGNTAVWANTYHRALAPNTQLGTWHMGHLGAGPGQALGAAVARPQAQVYCILGDGALGFHPQEIATAVRIGARVIFVVCADNQWGMVKATELFAFGAIGDQFPNALAEQPHINGDLTPIAWDELARAMGAHGERVADPAELAPALERCLEAGRCAVVHVDVDPAKHLMAPGLMHFKAMHQEPEGE